MRRALMSLCCALLLAGCPFLRPARDPMERVVYRPRGPRAARGAIVLLPGFGDRLSAFAEHGFVAALQRHAPDYDVVAADAHFGYYRTRTLLQRLDRDVVAPLRADGYRELWLAGTSLGGFGAVAYARTHPEGVRGVLLFAPYLGPDDVVREVARTGLCGYREQPGVEANEANFARANFVWLRRQACEERMRGQPDALRAPLPDPLPKGKGEEGDGRVSLWLAIGADDRLRGPDDVLGSALDPSHVLVLPGGHGWRVWTPALERLAPLAFDSSGVKH